MVLSELLLDGSSAGFMRTYVNKTPSHFSSNGIRRVFIKCAAFEEPLRVTIAAVALAAYYCTILE
jgi:hypothetical protein